MADRSQGQRGETDVQESPEQEREIDGVDREGPPQLAGGRRFSRLPDILGIGGGAISGLLVAVLYFRVLPIGVLLFPLIGAVIGGLLRHVGLFAGLGGISGLVVLAAISGTVDPAVMLIPVAVGGLVGVAWTAFRPRQTANALQEAHVADGGHRLWLARVCLTLGPLLGAAVGFPASRPALVVCILVGLTIGGASYLALTSPNSR